MSLYDTVILVLSWVFILSGSFFVIVGALGTLRFPDFWSRLHAASITDSAGVILLLVGMGMQAGLTLIAVKLLIIGVFLFITGPTATHAVANAALVSGLRPREAEGLHRPESVPDGVGGADPEVTSKSTGET
jgi:multicomponent Na+:H+ antiporter subunit G